VNDFLSTTGADFMEHMTALAAVSDQAEFKNSMAEYKAAKFTLVKVEGDKATINVEVPNQQIEPVEMVKVEGKWIPQELADVWPAKIQEAKDSLEKIDTSQMQKNKAPLMAQINMIDAQLNVLLDAKTEKSFNDQLSGLVIAAMMGGGGGGPPQTSFGGDFGPGPDALGGEDMPEEEGSTPGAESPKKKGFEDKTTNGDDPLFEKSDDGTQGDESATEAPESESSEGEPESKEPAESESETEAADESEKDAAEESEKDAPAEDSETEAPSEEEKPE
jgi:hypothetical protein